MTRILCPNCPVCSQPPRFLISTSQAACGNDDCPILLWDQTMTLDQNLTSVNPVDLGAFGQPIPPVDQPENGDATP